MSAPELGIGISSPLPNTYSTLPPAVRLRASVIMSSEGSMPITRPALVAQGRVERPVPHPRSTTVSTEPQLRIEQTVSSKMVGGLGRKRSYSVEKPVNLVATIGLLSNIPIVSLPVGRHLSHRVVLYGLSQCSLIIDHMQSSSEHSMALGRSFATCPSAKE